MVTKADLIQQRIQYEADKAEQEKERARITANNKTLHEAALMSRVEHMLDTDLGVLLQKANANGFDVIRIGCSGVWLPRQNSGMKEPLWDQDIGQPSPFQFRPEENHPPTIRLTEILRQAGFRVSFCIWNGPAIIIDWSN